MLNIRDVAQASKRRGRKMTENITGIPEILTSPIAIEFKEYLESIHPGTDWKEYLDLLVVIGQHHDEYGENPRTGNLASILQFTMDKVYRRAGALEGRYIRIIKPTHNGAFITIDSRRYWDFNRLENEFDSILEDLERFLAQNLQNFSDNDIRTAISILYAEIIEYREHNLFKAVSKYHTLIQKLNRSGIHHNLRDAQVKNTANRYELITQGEEIFCAWQRGEFHGRRPSRFEET
jgi:hypothetical protein